MKKYKEKATLWRYPGEAAWHFLTISKRLSAEIKETHGKHAKGFRSIPVVVTLEESTWNTSLFPDKKWVVFTTGKSGYSY